MSDCVDIVVMSARRSNNTIIVIEKFNIHVLLSHAILHCRFSVERQYY